MRRLTLLFALCAAIILALAPAALAQQRTDLDCSQIGTPGASPEEVQGQAQDMLVEDSTDPNGLDADGDGVACEFEQSPGGEVAFEDGTGFVSDGAAPAPQDGDVNCEDFASREEAQAVLEADPSDPNGLDADGDALACNELFSAPPTQAAEPSAQQYQIPEPSGVEVAPVTPPPGADSPVFQPSEPDVAEATPVSSSQRPSSTPETETADSTEAPAPDSSAPRPAAALERLPATGGSQPLMPALAGGALVATGLGALLVARRRPA